MFRFICMLCGFDENIFFLTTISQQSNPLFLSSSSNIVLFVKHLFVKKSAHRLTTITVTEIKPN